MKRNEGLQVKGKQLTMQWSKYNRREDQKTLKQKSNPRKETISKVWRPATRDNRFYEEFLSTSILPVEVRVPIDVKLEKGLHNAYICHFLEGKTMQTIKRVLEAKGVANLIMSRFDTLSCIISKVKGL